jgi:hypothetical protein
LFQAILLPNRSESRWRITLTTRAGRSELIFPQGWPGPASLSAVDENGMERIEHWDAWNPWPQMVEAFEEAVAAGRQGKRRAAWPSATRPDLRDAITVDPRQLPSAEPGPRPEATLLISWQDEIRCLELDDAARRSLARRRASTLEYQAASEETGFKGTMTLVGCSMIWLSLVLLILAVWFPWLVWLIIPVFGIFLLLQLLRWVVPGTPPDKSGTVAGPAGRD